MSDSKARFFLPPDDYEILRFGGLLGKSEPFEKKSFTPDTKVNEINLDVRDREIEVTLSDDEQVHIQYSENSKEYYDISVSDGNVLE